MSRPWNPGPRSKWTVIDGYAGARPRGTVPLVLIGAIALGLVAGIGWQHWSAPATGSGSAAIDWNAVQAVPQRAADGEDRAWEQRAEDSPSTGSGRADEGVRLTFGSCKWGGGTNCVVDGDTFYLGGQKVRIAGIDAPETHDYRCESELALGNRATDMLQQMLNSGAVTMTSIDRDRDIYGRLLRNVAVDGQDVGEAMISAGVAREYAGGRRPWC